MSDITIRNTKGFCEEFLKHYLAAGMGRGKSTSLLRTRPNAETVVSGVGH